MFATSSHHPAIFRCRARGSGQFHTRSKRPATPRGNTWWIGQVKGKASKLHYICGPSCTGAADDPFGLREHPGYGLRSTGQNSESVEAEEDTSWGSLKMSTRQRRRAARASARRCMLHCSPQRPRPLCPSWEGCALPMRQWNRSQQDIEMEKEPSEEVIFGQRRPDSLAIDWNNKMVYVLEFKRTSDQRRDYREKVFI
jgi:hypothetical protein